ncbi:unnamed protein product [Toxocara canis]|uniref:Ground-like domain-containing protein n=1 Tax=Toxocara canis TaxID=6265 RepID=A0A183UZS4_TOXCA|nr:unnamed protein product [Toxocara canis]
MVDSRQKKRRFVAPLDEQQRSLQLASLSRRLPTMTATVAQKESAEAKNIRHSQHDCQLREESSEHGETSIRNARIKFYKAYRKERNGVKQRSQQENNVDKPAVASSSANATNSIVRKDSAEDRQINPDRRNAPMSPPSNRRRALGVESSGYKYPLSQIAIGPPGIVPPGQFEVGAATPTSVSQMIPSVGPYTVETSVHSIQTNPVPPPPSASFYSSQNPYSGVGSYAQHSYETQPAQLLSEYAPTSTPPRFSKSRISPDDNNMAAQDNSIHTDEPVDFDAIRQPLMSEEPCYPPGPLCDREGLIMDDSGPVVRTDQRCNSMRLREIIISNIIEGDAESSKRAIQLVAERELGSFYNVLCGTGFFSYIAHADEFCLTATLGVNCYVFSPTCAQDIATMGIMKKRRKASRRKSFLSMN